MSNAARDRSRAIHNAAATLLARTIATTGATLMEFGVAELNQMEHTRATVMDAMGAQTKHRLAR